MTPLLPQIRLAEVLGALSHALDLAEGHPHGHCIRCCWIGTQLGIKLGLAADEVSDLYYTLLLKDLGCTGNAALIRDLYLADDIAFKRHFRLTGGSLPRALRFVLGHSGHDKGLAERLRALVHVLRNGGGILRQLIDARCQRGAATAARLRFSRTVCDGIRNLDEHWDGSGGPEGLTGRAIPVASQIALLAQLADLLTVSDGPRAAAREIGDRAGTWFDPAIADAFLDLQAEPGFWEILREDDLPAVVLHLEPARAKRWIDEDDLDAIVTTFAQIIDAKSRFTRGHSERVAVFADMIAGEMGFSPARRRWLCRAALLHDIGMLAVSNTILDKPSRLTGDEFAAIKAHPLHAERILKAITVLADLAPVASGHHERLDGTGYPRGLKDAQISLETRILTTADIFDALTADRPYRPAMPASQALAIMSKDIGKAIDPKCFDALLRTMKRAERQAA
jgi:HD-GYP domain-containing protein (c-di-GMP phosphodiesterase class II)